MNLFSLIVAAFRLWSQYGSAAETAIKIVTDLGALDGGRLWSEVDGVFLKNGVDLKAVIAAVGTAVPSPAPQPKPAPSPVPAPYPGEGGSSMYVPVFPAESAGQVSIDALQKFANQHGANGVKTVSIYQVLVACKTS